jgi:hypothetical protein|nr:MAG TPA: protein of unknown function DUF859 [Caudoviricetes sp.]
MVEFWSNNDRGYRIRLWIDQVSQNIQNNTSDVRIRLALLNQGWTFASYQCSGYVDGFGQRIDYSGSPAVLNRNSEIQLIDRTITVRHADDGSGVFGVHAHFNGSGGYSPGNLDIGNQGITLTTIPRGSSVSVPEGFIGNQVDITIDRKIAGATHTLRYAWGNKQGKIADNVGTSFKWTIPADFANDIPNAASGQGTIYVDTYVDGKLIQTQSTTLTASVVTNNMKPSFTGFTLTDTNATTQRIIPEPTHFVSVMSLVKVVFNGAQAKSGATIAGYYAEIVGASNSVSTNGGVFREVAVNKDTQMTLRGRVQDSRGIWSDWKEVKITFLFYFSPTLKFEVDRSGSKSDTLTIKRFAKIAPLSVNGVQKNTMKLTFTTTKVGTSNVVSDNGQAGGEWSSISEFKASNANLGKEYPADTSFVVTGKLEDRFSVSEFQTTVPTDKIIMSYDQQGVGIGKYRENGALDVDGLIYSGSKLIQHHKLTEPNGAAIDNKVDNLNDYRTTGFFSAMSTMKNYPIGKPKPTEQVGLLEVIEGLSGIHQSLTTSSGRFFKRTLTQNTVGNWAEFMQTNQPVVKKEIQIGYGVKANVVRKGDVVTLSLIRGVYSVAEGEYKGLSEKIPSGFKPCVQTHLVASKNVANWHKGCAVWHLEPNGNMYFSNQNSENAVYTGTVTYITEDEYPIEEG